VLFLLHPLYGWTATGFCALLFLLGALADRTTRGAVRQAGAMQTRVTADLTGRLRQAELLDCLGMLPAVLRRWQPSYLEMLEAQDAAHRRASRSAMADSSAERSARSIPPSRIAASQAPASTISVSEEREESTPS